MDLTQFIKDYPDFPKAGIVFKDIMPILANPQAFEYAIKQLENILSKIEYDVIIAPEARGFLLATPIALREQKPLIPARKKSKLPGELHQGAYELEYGTDFIEMQKDTLKAGQRAVVIDDLLATGGTVGCICNILENAGVTVSALAFLIELEGLPGREVLRQYNIQSIIKY